MIAQATPNPDWLSQLLGPAGLLVFLLIVVVFGGIKRWWVFGWAYEEAQRDRDMYREMALKGTTIAKASVETLKTVTDTAARREQ